MPCILNAANEVAVAAFLKEEIGFLAMSDLVEHCMNTVPFVANPKLEELIASDERTRLIAKEYLS